MEVAQLSSRNCQPGAQGLAGQLSVDKSNRVRLSSILALAHSGLAQAQALAG